MISISVDPDNVLRRPDFHDGYLRGIRVLRVGKGERTLVLWLQHIDGSAYKLIVPRLERLAADEFWEDNDVFDISFLTGANITDKALLNVYHDSGNESDLKWLESFRQRVHRENWTLLQITANYGCRLQALTPIQLESIYLEVESYTVMPAKG